MIKCENGRIEYSGDGFTLMADVGTTIVAVRDVLLEQCETELEKTIMRNTYERVLKEAMALPERQSDKDRAAKKNP